MARPTGAGRTHMSNQLTQSGSFSLDTPSFETVKRNLRLCSDAMNAAPTRFTKVECALIISIPITSVMTAVLPLFIHYPTTRFVCSALMAVSIALFLLQRLSIVQSLSRRHVYMVLGMLAGTFLFGLAIALMLSESIQLAIL